MTEYVESTEKEKSHVLGVLNNGEAACNQMLKQLEAIKFELKKTRMDFMSVRTKVFGKGKGKTGRSQ